MKKLITLFLVMLCAFAPVSVFAIDVNIDNEPLVMEVEPATVNGSTMVPMRAIFEALGAEIEWNNYTKGVTAIKDNKTVVLYMHDTNAYINGVAYPMSTPPATIEGRTMVPVRFVAEALDCYVYWDKYDQLVSIFTDAEEAEFYAMELQQKLAIRKAEEERIAAEKAEQARIEAERKAQAEVVNKQGRTVYVTPTGKKYHYSGSCNGGKYIPSTLDRALARGLTPCKKCV